MATLGAGIVSIELQLYSAPLGSTVFNPILGLGLTPSLTGVVPPNTVVTGAIHGFNIPIAVDTQLLLVVGTRSSGLTVPLSIIGTLQAGVAYRIAP